MEHRETPNTTQGGTEADQAASTRGERHNTKDAQHRQQPREARERHTQTDTRRERVPTLHTRRSAVERQAGKQGLVGVEVVVADTSARIAAAMAAVPDAARRY